MKLLEEKNTMYMQNTVSLEEELRKANAARSQLETYKRQVRTDISAKVLGIVQHIIFITWLITHSKKEIMNKQLHVFRRVPCPFLQFLSLSQVYISLPISSISYFLKKEQMLNLFFSHIIPNSYSVVGLE